MKESNNIPDFPSEDDVSFFLSGIARYGVNVNAKFLAMAYFGMCKHEFMSPDWLVHEFVWDTAFDKVEVFCGKETVQTMKKRIADTYQSSGYYINAPEAVRNTKIS